MSDWNAAVLCSYKMQAVALICLVLLLFEPSFAWILYVCPEVFKNGIPLEVYGGPLFPLAVVLKRSFSVDEPFWASLSGGYIEDILISFTTSNVVYCFREKRYFCLQMFRKYFGNRYNKLFNGPAKYAKYVNNETDPEKWGLTPLDDYTPEVLLTRRSILISCLYWCHAALMVDPKDRPLMSEICPNPCAQKGLCTEHGTVAGSCAMTNQGFFSNQYQCKCVKNYFWNEMMRTCVPEDPCNRMPPVCFPDGTRSCLFDAEFNEFSCFCKPSFMGKNCSLLANACEEHIMNPLLLNGGQLAMGKRACNVNNDANVCHSMFDIQMGPSYRCVCDEKRWRGDNTLRYDNCLKRVTKCDELICVKGTCVDSRDGTSAVCVCDPGYDSDMCATWTGVWSKWKPWGKCFPACGQERRAIRTRKCLVAEQIKDTDRLDCKGSATEFHACEPHICAVKKDDVLAFYFGIREQVFYVTAVLATVIGTGLSMLFMLFFSGLYARRTRRVFRNQET